MKNIKTTLICAIVLSLGYTQGTAIKTFPTKGQMAFVKPGKQYLNATFSGTRDVLGRYVLLTTSDKRQVYVSHLRKAVCIGTLFGTKNAESPVTQQFLLAYVNPQASTRIGMNGVTKIAKGIKVKFHFEGLRLVVDTIKVKEGSKDLYAKMVSELYSIAWNLKYQQSGSMFGNNDKLKAAAFEDVCQQIKEAIDASYTSSEEPEAGRAFIVLGPSKTDVYEGVRNALHDLINKNKPLAGEKEFVNKLFSISETLGDLEEDRIDMNPQVMPVADPALLSAPVIAA